MPNHRKLAREFTLFDNGYVSGTNSADGHAWSTQAMANEYLEHFYVGYSRTYPCEGEDPMAIASTGGALGCRDREGPDAPGLGRVLQRGQGRIQPEPNNWFEPWEDPRQRGPAGSHSAGGDRRTQPLAVYQSRSPLLAPLAERSVPGRCLFTLVMLASIGVPGLNGFVGEFLILAGTS